MAAPGYDSWSEDASVSAGMEAFSGHCDEIGGKTASDFLDLDAFVAYNEINATFFVLFSKHFRDALKQGLNLLFSVAVQIHIKRIAPLHLLYFLEP